MIHTVSSAELPMKQKSDFWLNARTKYGVKEVGNRKRSTQTIEALRALRADGLLRMAALELDLPSTKTWITITHIKQIHYRKSIKERL